MKQKRFRMNNNSTSYLAVSHGKYQNQQKNINYCDAPWPTNLKYKRDQIKEFGTPENHEKVMVRYMKHAPITRSFNGDPIVEDKISDNYIFHLQSWLKIIHENCFEGKDKFYEICDVAMVKIYVFDAYISLARVEVRPCAQGLGLIKLLLCQLIKTCQVLNKSLSVFEPVGDTKDICEYLFGKNDVSILRNFIIKYKIDSSNFTSLEVSHQYFDPLAKPKQHALNKFIRKDLYLIDSRDINIWNETEMLDKSLTERCKVTAMISAPYFRNDVLVINHSYFPPASDLNDQEKVDARYDALLKARLMRHSEENIPHTFIIHPFAQIDDGVNMGYDCTINRQVRLLSETTIGDGVLIDKNTLIEKDCSIGDECEISRQCTIGEHTRVDNDSIMGARVKIGKQCQIATKVKLCKDVNIGKGSLVGDNTIINKYAKIGEECVLGKNTVIRKYTNIGDKCIVGFDAIISYNVSIGSNVVVGINCTINPEANIQDGVKIGDNVLIGRKVVIGTNCEIQSNSEIKDEVKIGDNVMIGNRCIIDEKCVIVNGTHIEDGTHIHYEFDTSDQDTMYY